MTDCKSYLGDQRTYFAKDHPPQCWLAQVFDLIAGIIHMDPVNLLHLRDMIFMVIGVALIVHGALVTPKPKITKKSESAKVEDGKNEADPYDILKTRLAKGEITKEEFDELKKRFE